MQKETSCTEGRKYVPKFSLINKIDRRTQCLSFFPCSLRISTATTTTTTELVFFFDSGLFILQWSKVIKSKKNKKLMHLEVLDVCDFPYIYSLSVRQFLKISFVFEATVTRTTVFDLSSSFLKWK